jgi:hypothetical protein
VNTSPDGLGFLTTPRTGHTDFVADRPVARGRTGRACGRSAVGEVSGGANNDGLSTRAFVSAEVGFNSCSTVGGVLGTGVYCGVECRQILDSFDHGRRRRAEGTHDHGVTGELSSVEKLGEIARRVDVFTDGDEVECLRGAGDDNASDVIDEHDEFGACHQERDRMRRSDGALRGKADAMPRCFHAHSCLRDGGVSWRSGAFDLTAERSEHVGVDLELDDVELKDLGKNGADERGLLVFGRHRCDQVAVVSDRDRWCLGVTHQFESRYFVAAAKGQSGWVRWRRDCPIAGNRLDPRACESSARGDTVD